MNRITELVKEVQNLGDADSPDTTLMIARLMELASILENGKDVEIPDEAFTSLKNDLRIVAMAGFIILTIQGIESGAFN